MKQIILNLVGLVSVVILQTCPASAEEISPVEIKPTATSPFQVPADPDEKKKLVQTIQAYMAQPPNRVTVHPAAQDFPGVPLDDSARVSKDIFIDCSKTHWQSTGLYAYPGDTTYVSLPTPLPEGVKVEVRVGCHSDRLFGESISQWKRFPQITRVFEIDPEDPTPISSAFGGPIFVIIKNPIAPPPDNAKPVPPSNYRVRFRNVITAPYFVLGKTLPKAWKLVRNAPGSWAELVGRNAILHIPSEQVRHMEDPAPLLNWWDSVVAAQDSLVGKKRTEQERIVVDCQIINGGSMHSGYPLMCTLDTAPILTSLQKLRSQGHWGIFNELGHNHQSTAWTFPGQTEVTSNLFALYCMETIVGKPRGTGHPKLEGGNLLAALDRRFAEQPSEDPFDQLAPFIVLIHKFGWEPLKNTLVSYQTSPVQATDPVEQRQAEFVRRYSHNAGADLSGFFKKMGYSCPSEGELQPLTPFDYEAWRKENAPKFQ